MARKPNYRFDRQQREKSKAEKKAAKAEKKAERIEVADPDKKEDSAETDV